MSLRIKQYKLVTRDWLTKQLKDLNNWCECKYCSKLKFMKIELEKNSFNTLNKTINWWRISEGWDTITVYQKLMIANNFKFYFF